MHQVSSRGDVQRLLHRGVVATLGEPELVWHCLPRDGTDDPPVSQPRPPRPTGADVARLAGVSASTVSYVLTENPRQRIPEATRQRVLDAAAALNYRPSPAARTLKLGRSDVVLGLMPAMDYSPAYHTSFTALAAALRGAGLTLLVHPLPANSAAMGNLWRSVTPACVFSFTSLAEEDVSVMRAAGIQVAVSCAADQAQRRPWELSLGGHDLGRAQAAHLLDRGHTDIGVAIPDTPAARPMASGRIEAMADVLVAAGHPRPYVCVVPNDPESARAVLQRWRLRHPQMTAIAAFSDDIGAAIVGAAAHLRIRVPDQLAVMGAYDYLTGRLSTPALTTIQVDLRTQMEAVSSAIVDALRGIPLSDTPLTDSTLTLVPRDST